MKSSVKIALIIILYIIIGAVLFYVISLQGQNPDKIWIYYIGVYFAGICLVGMGCVCLSKLKTPAKIFWLCLLFNGFASFGAMI